MKLSVITPLYNADKYIRKCVESVYKQDLDLSEFELIIVNDGSKDNSLEVALSLSKEYPNIIVLDQENQGEGGARNTALKHAKGEYILCLDSDDYLEPHSISPLLHFALDNDVEILFYDIIMIYEGGVKKETSLIYNKDKCNKILTGKEAIALYRYHHSVCTSLFKRSFIVKHGVSFSPSIWGTDVLFITTLLLQAKRVYRSDKMCYNYVMHNPHAVTFKKNENPTHNMKIADARFFVSIKLSDMIRVDNSNTPKETAFVINNSIRLFTLFGINKLIKSKNTTTVLLDRIKKLQENNLYPIGDIKYDYVLLDKAIRVLFNNKIILIIINRFYKLIK